MYILPTEQSNMKGNFELPGNFNRNKHEGL